MKKTILIFSIISLCFNQSNPSQLSIKTNTKYNAFDSREWVAQYKGKEISEGQFYEMTNKVNLEKKYNIYMNKRKNGIFKTIVNKKDTSTPKNVKWIEFLPSTLLSSSGIYLWLYAWDNHSYKEEDCSSYCYSYLTNEGSYISIFAHIFFFTGVADILLRTINYPKINIISHKDALALSVKFNLN